MQGSFIAALVISIVMVAFLTTIVHMPSVVAQRNGSAVKGGSLARERITEDPPQSDVIPEKYRNAIKRLNLDYTEIAQSFFTSRKLTSPPTLREVLLTHMVAQELAPADARNTAGKMLALLRSHRTLDQVVAEVFHLSLGVAHEQTRAAKKQLRKVMEQP
ncbi:MAG: hypothetical protein ACR2HX_02995 [Pyrinomonadaceae bacterium]